MPVTSSRWAAAELARGAAGEGAQRLGHGGQGTEVGAGAHDDLGPDGHQRLEHLAQVPYGLGRPDSVGVLSKGASI